MTTPALDFDELDDFDSPDFEDVDANDHSYLKGMWGGFRQNTQYTSDSLAADTVHAHGMVQSFVNAFARDGFYVVSFDDSTETAGTDMRAKNVVITPSPIADRNLTAEEAGLILTGLAVHEICHPRYGRMTSQAVERMFPYNRVAQRLSNLLDDIRIERRFVADYPGYAGIFTPTLNYVGARGLQPGQKRQPALTAPVNLAIAATRYPAFSDWSDPAVAAEGAWWNAWADKWSPEDAPKRHAEAIREALQHIVNVKAATPPPPPPVPQAGDPSPDGDPTPSDEAPQHDDSAPPQQAGAEPGEGEPDPTNISNDGLDDNDTETEGESAGGSAGNSSEGDATEDEFDASTGPGDAMDDSELNAATKNADADEDEKESSCSGSGAVDKAAAEGDTTDLEIFDLKHEAQRIVENARNNEDDGHGNKVDVNQSMKGLTNGADGRPTQGSEYVSRLIRNAIIQSRTGHMDHEPYRRTGRLDQRALTRTAHGDFRVFEKRTAPSPGNYLFWLLVDASASMDGYSLIQATRVAHSIASGSTSIPSARMAIWAWTTAFRHSSYADAGVAKVWETGQQLRNIFKMANTRTGYTPDATVMGWAARAILKAAHSDEIPVIVMISDGAGDYNMNERVKEARDMGIIVISVSFGNGFSEKEQVARFGEGNCIPYAGSIEKTGKPLARLIMKIVTGGYKR